MGDDIHPSQGFYMSAFPTAELHSPSVECKSGRNPDYLQSFLNPFSTNHKTATVPSPADGLEQI